MTESDKKEIIETLRQLEGVKSQLHAILRRHYGKETVDQGAGVRKEGKVTRTYAALVCVKDVGRR